MRQEDVMSRIFTARGREKCREKWTMGRWTKRLHIDGEELGKIIEGIECEARDLILRAGDDARNIESKLNHITQWNFIFF